MYLEFQNNQISLKKELSNLDTFVVSFSKILDNNNINHVFVSGYIAIVFGRSRNTEDIDVLIEQMEFEQFKILWKHLRYKYNCINTDDAKDAYEILVEKGGVRFYEGKNFIPNMEMKFSLDNVEKYSLKNKIILKFNTNTIPISPIELQIVYKLYLSSEKDIEDARFIFKLFLKWIDKTKIDDFSKDFNVTDKLYLLGNYYDKNRP
ncbi:MAG: hypothetical protein K0B07_02470 [DPANN group archaeon]|nr:hypothetical protein [DPANN group archaeon]